MPSMRKSLPYICAAICIFFQLNLADSVRCGSGGIPDCGAREGAVRSRAGSLLPSHHQARTHDQRRGVRSDASTSTARPPNRRSLPPATMSTSNRTWYVSSSGEDSDTCGILSGAAACATLGAVLSKDRAALEGSTVLVEPAQHAYACPDTTVRANITIQSSVAASKVIFDCGNGKQWVRFSGGNYITSVVLKDLDVRRCNSTGNGGCIDANNIFALSVVRSSFLSCRASGSGGCVRIAYDGEAAGTQVVFESVQVTGAVSGIRGVSAGSGAVSIEFGGAARSSAVSFRGNFSCTDATVAAGNGGCVAILYNQTSYGSIVSFDGDLRLANCSASDRGGCVSVFYRLPVHNSATLFEGTVRASNCSAGYDGGCVSVHYMSSARSSSLAFKGNTSMSDCTTSGNGGCVSVAYGDTSWNSTLACSGATSMSRCSAATSGGCISLLYNGNAYDSAFRLEGETGMRDCSAGTFGGCVSLYYFGSVVSSAVELGGYTAMSTCEAQYGGCVSVYYNYDARASRFVASAVTSMSACSASSFGGCVSLLYNQNASDVAVAFRGDTAMSNCSAATYGGCVSLYYVNTASNVSTEFAGSTRMMNCSGGSPGGCVSILYNEDVDNGALTFLGRTRMSRCSAGSFGGCVSMYSFGNAKRSTLAFRGSTSMSHCSAGSFGGCVSSHHDGTALATSLVLSGSTSMTDCTAQFVGGCVSLTYNQHSTNSTLSVDGVTTMSHCFAQYGGCLSQAFLTTSNSSALMFRGNTSFSDCAAVSPGGCVAVDYSGTAHNSTLSFAGDTRMSHCSAGSFGGCVSLLFSGNVLLSTFVFQGSTSMQNCSARNSGGCVSYVVRGARIRDSTLAFRGKTDLEHCFASYGACVYILHAAAALREVSAQFEHVATQHSESLYQGGSVACVFLSDDAQRIAVAFQNVSMQNATASRFQSFGGGISVQCTPATPFTAAALQTNAAVWNQTCAVSFRSVSIRNARATYGGGIDLQHGTHELRDVALLHTSASNLGGGIRVTGTASVQLRACQLTNCSSDSGSSSALDIRSQGALTVDGLRALPVNESSRILVIRGVSNLEMGNLSVSCPAGYTYSSAQTMFSLAMYPWVLRDNTCCSQTSYESSCTACPKGMYALRGGSIAYPDLQCLPVPFGAESAGAANIAARPGYWGAPYPPGNEIAMYMCPEGYCCRGPRACAPVSHCDGNRDGILCGSCRRGYSQTYSSSECVENGSCGQALFFVAAVVFALGVAAYYVYVKRAGTSGMSGVVVGFYQLLPVLLVSTSPERLWERGIADVFNLRVPAASGSGSGKSDGVAPLCPVAGLEAVGKRVLHLAVPLLVALMVAALYFVESKVMKRVQLRGRFAAGALLLAMLAYVSVLESTFSLLHCVPVLGEKRLFVSGDIVCYQGWQVFLFFVVVALYAFPLAVFWCGRSGGKYGALLQRYQDAVGSKFRDGWSQWEAVLLVKRLVFVSVYVFVIDVYVRMLVLCVLCIVAVVLHMHVQPYRGHAAQRFETFVLCESCMVALINARSAAYVSATITPAGPEAAVTEHLDTLLSVLVVLPLAVYCTYNGVRYLRERIVRNRSISSSLTVALVERRGRGFGGELARESDAELRE